jgi:CDP-paratose 2-epimerase
MNPGTGTRHEDPRPTLITGGCGFIGCNLANALADSGKRVLILDNLARPGVQDNAHWLKAKHGDRVEIKVADVRDMSAVTSAVSRASSVLHLAGQVAVTASLDRPVDDFEVNARGTLNVLEAVRLHNADAPIVFASTNKVYGRLLDDRDIDCVGRRYVPDAQDLAHGVDERAPLDLYSTYGC